MSAVTPPSATSPGGDPGSNVHGFARRAHETECAPGHDLEHCGAWILAGENERLAAVLARHGIDPSEPEPFSFGGTLSCCGKRDACLNTHEGCQYARLHARRRGSAQ